MSLSPLCQVQVNSSPYVATTNGVDASGSSTINVRLTSTTSVSQWYLQCLGTDETSTNPTPTNVDPSTFLVTSPSSIPSFTLPSGTGQSYLFQSTVTGPGGPLQTTFSIFVPTANGDRVGSVGEAREGSTTFGWITKLNPILRQGAAYLYYNDTLESPTTGSSNIQGALDYLKVHSSAGIVLENDGTPIAGNPHTTLNGIDITSTDAGGGQANLTVTGIQSIHVPTPSGSNVVLTYNSGAYTWASGGSGNAITAITGDVFATGPGSVLGVVANIASLNQTSPGSLRQVAIWGALLNPQDSAANGISPPTIGSGPPGGQVGHTVWETTYSSGAASLYYGWLSISQSGSAVCLAPEVYGTHNSQACFRGALQATARLTGISTSGTFDFNIPSGHSAKLQITVTARVVTVGSGGIEALGDTYSITTFATAKNVSGTVSIVPNFYALPFEDYDPSMADVSTNCTSTGTQVQISYVNGSLIGTGCVIDYQIDIDGRVC